MFGECLRRASVEAVVAGIPAACTDVYAPRAIQGVRDKDSRGEWVHWEYDARAQRPAFKRKRRLTTELYGL